MMTSGRTGNGTTTTTKPSDYGMLLLESVMMGHGTHLPELTYVLTATQRNNAMHSRNTSVTNS
eukprot:scaffold453824_cov21-Prasinocladus_malaysianus.AAC.1